MLPAVAFFGAPRQIDAADQMAAAEGVGAGDRCALQPTAVYCTVPRATLFLNPITAVVCSFPTSLYSA